MKNPFPESWAGVIALDTETYGGFGVRTAKATEWACPYSIFLARLGKTGRVTDRLGFWVNPSELAEDSRIRSLSVTANLCAGRDPDGPVPTACAHYTKAFRQHLHCLAEGVDFAEATRQILAFVGDKPAGYLGSNVLKFDINTVLRNIGCTLPTAPIYDTRELYEYVAGNMGTHSLPLNKYGLDRSLGTIGRVLGLTNPAPHTAEGDTLECIEAALTLQRIDKFLSAAWPVEAK